eukprot:COSAG03_NODE_3556_length_1949_cov_210.192973_3_plen_57_part_01
MRRFDAEISFSLYSAIISSDQSYHTIRSGSHSESLETLPFSSLSTPDSSPDSSSDSI